MPRQHHLSLAEPSVHEPIGRQHSRSHRYPLPQPRCCRNSDVISLYETEEDERRDAERRYERRRRRREEERKEEEEEEDRRRKKSAAFRIRKWSKIGFGVFIVSGLVFVFYVITTLIIDGSSPLDFYPFQGKDPPQGTKPSDNGTEAVTDRNTPPPEIIREVGKKVPDLNYDSNILDPKFGNKFLPGLEDGFRNVTYIKGPGGKTYVAFVPVPLGNDEESVGKDEEEELEGEENGDGFRPGVLNETKNTSKDTSESNDDKFFDHMQNHKNASSRSGIPSRINRNYRVPFVKEDFQMQDTRGSSSVNGHIRVFFPSEQEPHYRPTQDVRIPITQSSSYGREPPSRRKPIINLKNRKYGVTKGIRDRPYIPLSSVTSIRRAYPNQSYKGKSPHVIHRNRYMKPKVVSSKEYLSRIDRRPQRPYLRREIRLSRPPPPEYRYPATAGSIQDIIQYMKERDAEDEHPLSKDINDKIDFQRSGLNKYRLSPDIVIGDQDHIVGLEGHKFDDRYPYRDRNRYSENSYDDPIPDIQTDHRYDNGYDPLPNDYGSTSQYEILDSHHITEPLPPVRNTYNSYDINKQSKNSDRPLKLTLDIYPTPDSSSGFPRGEPQYSIGGNFRSNGYDRRPIPEGDTQEVVLHLNFLTGESQINSGNLNRRQDQMTLEIPLNGNLSPLDIYEAIVSKARGPRALPQAGQGDGSPSPLEEDSPPPLFDLKDGPSLFLALEKGLKEVDLLLPEGRKILFSQDPVSEEDLWEAGRRGLQFGHPHRNEDTIPSK